MRLFAWHRGTVALVATIFIVGCLFLTGCREDECARVVETAYLYPGFEQKCPTCGDHRPVGAPILQLDPGDIVRRLSFEDLKDETIWFVETANGSRGYVLGHVYEPRFPCHELNK
jgi:hypothetical protein